MKRPRDLPSARSAALCAVLLAGGLLGACSPAAPPSPLEAWSKAPPEVRALLWPEPRPLPAFALRTQHGEAFGPQDFRGQWNFVFFGFLQCPDVCPTTLSALRAFRRAELAQDPEAARHRFVFVSVDPGHDSAEAIGAYLGFFDPDFIGLHGPQDALTPLLQGLSIMAVPVESPGGGRSIDHTSSVIVIDPSGHAVGALPPPHEPQAMQARFARLRAYLEAR